MSSTITLTVRSTCKACLELAPTNQNGLCLSCESLNDPEGVLLALLDDHVVINAAREAAGDPHHAGEE